MSDGLSLNATNSMNTNTTGNWQMFYGISRLLNLVAKIASTRGLDQLELEKELMRSKSIIVITARQLNKTIVITENDVYIYDGYLPSEAPIIAQNFFIFNQGRVYLPAPLFSQIISYLSGAQFNLFGAVDIEVYHGNRMSLIAPKDDIVKFISDVKDSIDKVFIQANKVDVYLNDGTFKSFLAQDADENKLISDVKNALPSSFKLNTTKVPSCGGKMVNAYEFVKST